MRKVQVTLPESNGGSWGSIKTKYPKDSSKVNFNDFTGTSKNFDTDATGAITKRPGGINFNASTFTGAPKDLYEAIFANGTRHMLTMADGVLKHTSGGGTFSDVTSGYSTSGNMEFTSYQDRVYFGNGIDNPQVYDIQTSYGGVTYVAPKTKQMGCIIPSSACTAPATGSGSVGSVPNGAHTYKVTYLYYGSEESNGNVVSGVCTVTAPASTVALTAIPVGGYGVSARKVYRDNNDGNWLLVGTISNNTATTYSDTAATGTTAIPTDNGMPPLASLFLQYLDRIWLDGVSAASSTVYFSDAGKPDIFPSTNYIVCNPRDPIIGMVVYSGKILIFNRNSMGWIMGRTKDTFRYEEIPSSIGCSDTRSIQIRTVRGVPTLIWLSDKGLYEFNGSSINYVSEGIEDQLNVNIQQASQVKGKNTQDTTTDFTAGTASAGVAISGGTVSQANPIHTYNNQTLFTAGTKTNLSYLDGSNTIKVPTQAAYVLDAGGYSSLSGSSSLVMATASSASGSYTHSWINSNSNFNFRTLTTSGKYYAQIFSTPDRAGTMTSVGQYFITNAGARTAQVLVYSDNSGNPGSLVATLGTITVGAGAASGFKSTSCSWSYAPNIAYWLVFNCTSHSAWSGDFGGSVSGSSAKRSADASSWSSIQDSVGQTCTSMALTYAYTSATVSNTGTWTSATHDTNSDAAVPATISHTSTTVTSTYTTSTTTTVEGSNNGSTWDVSQVYSNLNGSSAVALAGRRYWRVKIQLSTTDDVYSSIAGAPTLKFTGTSTWVSAAIDHTTDITALNSLTVTSSIPTGTSVSSEVATSSDNSTYSAYSVVGSATPARYTKIRITLTSDAANALTASVSSVILRSTVVSTLVSSAIDTGATPVGWELFTAAIGSLGTVTWSVKTAANSGGLAGASWVTVTSGTYITATVNPFIQWRGTLTSTADAQASIDSVVVNWFISSTQSIRVASIFDGLSYYLSAAEYGQTTNNIVFKLEKDNNFRVYRGLAINCFTSFFNDVYYGRSTEGRVVKWLTGLDDQGTNIELDIQTAAISYEDTEHTKILRKVYVTGKGTGAAYTPQYSVDDGATWKQMVNPLTGLTTFTTVNDGMPFIIRLQPVFSTDNATGSSHIVRLVSNDARTCQIESIKLSAWIRNGEPR